MGIMGYVSINKPKFPTSSAKVLNMVVAERRPQALTRMPSIDVIGSPAIQHQTKDLHSSVAGGRPALGLSCLGDAVACACGRGYQGRLVDARS